MANFGLSDLVVVKPYAPVWRETVSAVGAEKLVLAARRAGSLPEAVDDCDLVVGATAVRNRRLERPLVRLPDLSKLFQKSKFRRVAILFGSEKTGLSNAYLDKCRYLLTIPTSPDTPSMNLAQAVAVCCYELARSEKGFGFSGKPADNPPAEMAQVALLVQQWRRLFESVNYLPFLPAPEKEKKIRRTLLQWNLRKMDVRLLHGVCRYVLKKTARE